MAEKNSSGISHFTIDGTASLTSAKTYWRENEKGKL